MEGLTLRSMQGRIICIIGNEVDCLGEGGLFENLATRHVRQPSKRGVVSIISCLPIQTRHPEFLIKHRGGPMNQQKLHVPNISCKHCVMTIKNELMDLKGMKNVEGDPETKIISMQWDSPLTLEKIKSVLKEINYPAE
jgi:copper chaperone